jgi:small subunit ribosomal protein S12
MGRLLQNIKKNYNRETDVRSKLLGNPQKKAVCLSVTTVSPKKPNSANRRITSVNIPSYSSFAKVKLVGEGIGNLQQHSTILIRGVRLKDLIGIHLAGVRGKFDLSAVSNRNTSRSLYGVSKN